MNIERSEEQVLRLATSVVDDEAVDWEREASTDTDVRRQVRNLRLIRSIGDVHREVREDLLGGTQALKQRRKWGKLEIRELLGAGSFGNVYRASDPDLECEVALKLPHPGALPSGDQRGRFLEEARKLAKIRHDNVLRVLGAEEHDGRVGIWMELIEGRTLEELLGHAGRFSSEEATSIGIDLCRALAAVHSAGLIHRDVKTANVRREEGGRIVLLDLGTATERTATKSVASTSAPLSGTPRFMAPEQFDGTPATRRSDLYALAVVLYRLVTVSYPVKATTLEEMLEKHRRGELTPLLDVRPDLPRRFVRVVERALSTNPNQRFSSAGEMEQALDASRAPDLPPGPLLKPRKAPWILAAVAAVILIAITLYGWPTARLEVDGTFYSLDAQGRGLALSEGAQLKLGDRVYFELDASRDVYVYLVNEDLAGRTIALFPLSNLDRSNPLEAGKRHRLPGRVGGVRKYWKVNTPGDIETFHVIVSTTANAEIEALVEALPEASSSVRVEPDLLLRGLGGLDSGPEPIPGSDGVLDLSERLADLAATESGLWCRRYQFRSPRPTE